MSPPEIEPTTFCVAVQRSNHRAIPEQKISEGFKYYTIGTYEVLLRYDGNIELAIGDGEPARLRPTLFSKLEIDGSSPG